MSVDITDQKIILEEGEESAQVDQAPDQKSLVNVVDESIAIDSIEATLYLDETIENLHLVAEDSAATIEVQEQTQDVSITVDNSNLALTSVVDQVTLDVQEQGTSGPPGPPGPPGVSGDNNFVHNQIEPSTEWIIVHDLGKQPSVDVVDSAGSVVFGDVSYGTNLIIVRFDAPFGGKVFLN